MQQHHADLRTEPRSQVYGVLNGIVSAFRQVQLSQFRIDFPKVGDRGYATGFQRLDRDDIFDARTHGVTGEALGVGDHNAIRDVAEDATKRVDLGRGAAAPRWCVGFMGNENCLRRDLATRNAAARFGFGDQGLHHLADVLDIETSTVESAVARHGGQHFADGLYSSFTRGVGAFHYQSGGAHTDDHSVPAAVEGNSGICDHFVGGCRTTGQEASAHPIDQMVGCHVVGGNDDYPLAPPDVNPVLRQRHRLRVARAGRVDLSVGTAGADEFGKLRMSHGQDAEQEAPVEDIRFFVDGGAQLVDAPL